MLSVIGADAKSFLAKVHSISLIEFVVHYVIKLKTRCDDR